MDNILRLINDLSDNLGLLEGNKIPTLDFTKKEDVEKLEKAIDELKNNSLFSKFIGEDLYDSILKVAHKTYEEAHKNDQPDQPKRPSIKVNEKVKENIQKLVDEYLETMIIPYVKMTNEQIHYVSDSLSEFACWMYQK